MEKYSNNHIRIEKKYGQIFLVKMVVRIFKL